MQGTPSHVMNANADITHPFILDTHYLLNPMFCCDSGGIKGIPFSPMAQATLLDTFPEVIRVSWLLPSASNEKGTPRETPDYTDIVEKKRVSLALVGKQTVDEWNGGDRAGRMEHDSNQRHWTSSGSDAQNWVLVLALTAACRPYIMNEAPWSGTICVPILVLPLNSCATINRLLNFSEPSFLYVWNKDKNSIS